MVDRCLVCEWQGDGPEKKLLMANSLASERKGTKGRASAMAGYDGGTFVKSIGLSVCVLRSRHRLPVTKYPSYLK